MFEGNLDPKGRTEVRLHGRPLASREDLASRMADWAHDSEGNSHLALTMLAAACDDDTALAHASSFRRCIVQNLPKDIPWQISLEEVRRFADQADAARF